MIRRTIGLVTLLALPALAQAAVVLNELLPNPFGTDNDNETVEIFNTGPGTVDLTGWCIEDAATIDNGTIRRRIPEDFDPLYGSSAVLGPGEFRVVRGTGATWGQPYLNNGGDTVYLNQDRTGNLGSVVYSTSYGSANSGDCWANVPDGAMPQNFAWRTCTPGVSNCAADAFRPAPVDDLAATAGAYVGEVDLVWTSVGNDSLTGLALQHVVKYNTVPIDASNFDSSSDAFNEPLPAVSGTQQSMTVFGLDPNTYYFALKTLDCQNSSGLSNVASSAPGTTPLPFFDQTAGLEHYYGNLHSHTGYSDGADTPAVAYAYARNIAPTPLDFLAVTDHNHGSAGPMTPALYQQGLAAATTANDDGSFVAIYGQEWGLATNGHVNIFESPVLYGWETGNFDVFVAQDDYPGLFAAILANPGPWGSLAAFCHPGSGEFDDYAFDSAGTQVMRGMALVNGPAFSTATDEGDVGNTNYDPQYGLALQRGYFVGPFGDQDNHNGNWGASTQSRTVVLATELSKAAVLGAIRDRNTYATQDHNAQVDLAVQGYPMGSQLTAEVGAGVYFDILVSDPDGEQVQQFELFRGIRGSTVPTLVATAENVDHFVHRDEELPVPPQGVSRVYYVRITQDDGHRIWTAPVEVSFEVGTDVTNLGSRPNGGLELVRSNPFHSVTELRFALPPSGAGHVVLSVFDVSGRHVRTLVQGVLQPGSYDSRWDGRDEGGRKLGSGVYFVRLNAPGLQASRRVVLVR